MNNKIKIVGWIFIIFGILAVVSIIYDATRQKLNINLAALMVLVGIGILKGKESSRKWGRIWCWMVIVFAALCGIVSPFGIIYKSEFISNWRACLIVYVVILAIGLLFYWCGKILSKNYFYAAQQGDAPEPASPAR